MQFPNFTSIDRIVQNELRHRASLIDPSADPLDSNGNPTVGDVGKFPAPTALGGWIRAISAAAKAVNGNTTASTHGLVIGTNILQDGNIYGVMDYTTGGSLRMESSATMGRRWGGQLVQSEFFEELGQRMPLRPRPIIDYFEVDEAMGSISRKATLKFKAYTIEQLQTLITYFLEPGFSVFVEWGWNDPTAFTGYSETITKDYIISRGQDMSNLRNIRLNSNGRVDTYLGFVTGGTFQLEDDSWSITTNLVGFVELPTWLNVADSHVDNVEQELRPQLPYIYDEISLKQVGDMGESVDFKYMFNSLPTHASARVRNFLTNSNVDGILLDLLHPVNYLNFTPAPTSLNTFIDNIKNPDYWRSLLPWLRREASSTADSLALDNDYSDFDTLPIRYIRLGAALKIIQIIVNLPNDTDVIKWNIRYDDVRIKAFPYMFSHSLEKVFIPNSKLPRYDIINNSMKTDNTIDASVTKGSDSVKIQFPEDDDGDGIYGKLTNLYINFDKFIEEISTRNFNVKDCLYNILNYTSSAVGNIWNFQLEFDESKNVPEIRIVDLNYINRSTHTDIYEFDLYNKNSIILEHSFNVDIPAAVMNQVVGNRLSLSINTSLPNTYRSSLFGYNYTDLVVGRRYQQTSSNDTPNTDTPSDNVNDFEESASILRQKLRVLVYRIREAQTSSISDAPNNSSLINYDRLVENEILPALRSVLAYEVNAELLADINAVFDASDGLTPTPVLYEWMLVVRTGTRRSTLSDYISKPATFTTPPSRNSTNLLLSNLDTLVANLSTYRSDEILRRDEHIKSIFKFIPDFDISTKTNSTYPAGYADIEIFNYFKRKHDMEDTTNVSTMLPVRVTLTLYGISGIRRGDMFRVNGIPDSFNSGGFFQVVSIKHIVSDMVWKTVIEGAFRRYMT